MVHVDMTQPDRDLTPGVDLWKVVNAEVGESRKGDKMLKLKFARVSDPTEHMFDNIMLAGGGWPIGKKKLGAFVAADFNGDLDPVEIRGTRVWIGACVKEYEGKNSLTPDIKQLKHGGFQREEDVPPGCALPEPVDDTPPF